MDVSRIRVLRGPNLWSRHTAIEAIVSCPDVERAIAGIAGFEARLRERFPKIGFLEAGSKNEVVSMAHALEIAALGLQSESGCPVTFAVTVPTMEAGVYQVIVEYTRKKSASWLSSWRATVPGGLDDQPSTWQGAGAPQETGRRHRLGPSTGSIVQAAVARGIPFRRLTGGSMVQFGWGSRQRRIQAAETNHTSAIAESIAQDKDLTKKLLNAAGVPVPMGRVVSSAEEAWAAAQEIASPVVLKPRDGNQGKGVAVNITAREQVMAAFAVAAEICSEVIVERYLPADFRLLVIGSHLRPRPARSAASDRRWRAPSPAGGPCQQRSTARRRPCHIMTKIRFDAIALGDAGETELRCRFGAAARHASCTQ